jgi:hypothetical protein
MINDLFEVSSIQAGKLKIELQCTSVADAIAYTINTMQGAATDKGITLASEIEEKLPSVCADPARVRQILVILVDNATKFTPANGTVKVEVRVFEEDPNFLLLEVTDSGCGIDPDKTERIFERLFQASDPAAAAQNGLGLGLYICNDLVTRQGGKIWAKSAPGQGSVFSVTFPILSLPKLLAPAFRDKRHGQLPITLVVTEIGSQTGWLSNDVRAEQCRGIRELLRGSLYSDGDILLPKMDFTGPTELFFIVAITGEIGGEAISNRIRKQFDNFESLGQAGLTHSISHQSLDPTQRSPTESMENYLERVASSIQELMNKEISSRQVSHG